ncbi:MAG: ABC transporter ATP-binding protein [Candidatus Brocadiia bacterium]
MAIVELENVTKVYPRPAEEVRALDDVSLSIEEGEFVAVKGPSGSGKSTLLLTAGAMVAPTSGRVVLAGTDVYGLSPGARAAFRASNIGFVFQLFHLVPYLTVLENVLLPGLTGVAPGDGRARAGELLERFGLGHRTDHRPAELSIGERQRVAMARALLNRPRLILADEPTGNLDPQNAADVMGYLEAFHREGATVLVVSHEATAQRYAQRTLLIRQGRLGTLETAAAEAEPHD